MSMILDFNLSLIFCVSNGTKFDMKQEILLIKHVLNIKSSLKNVLHGFMKCFSGARENQVVNKYLNCSLSGLCNLRK